MGKKSKKKSKPTKGGEHPQHHQQPTMIEQLSGLNLNKEEKAIPVGVCYFCLGEEADEGKPLVRDCSCRGSAGFSHFTCLTKYIEQKCKQADYMEEFVEPWTICNNCKQPFQNQLSIDLASSFVSFAEAAYDPDSSKWDKLKVVGALRTKIIALKGTDPTDKNITITITSLLSLVDQMKKDLKMSRWIHMPRDSEEYKYYTHLSRDYEAFAYASLGCASLIVDSSEEGIMIAITHWKKARAIFTLVGLENDTKDMDDKIAFATNLLSVHDEDMLSAATSSILQRSRNTYEIHLNEDGINSDRTIQSALQYVRVLRLERHCIDADRLITKVATICRRVHGLEHNVTIEAEELLQKCKERYVIVLPNCKHFQALRYENDGEYCVVQGPIREPRKTAKEKIYHVTNNLIIPDRGFPVICHGLVSAAHLNGEVGVVKFTENDGTGILRAVVHFEKKSLKSASIKPENLRIAFDLPSEDLVH
jgi:hypothetical protein